MSSKRWGKYHPQQIQLQEVISSSLLSTSLRQKGKLTPLLIVEAPPAHGGAAKEQILILQLARLRAVALDLLFGLRVPAVVQGPSLDQSTDPRSEIVRIVSRKKAASTMIRLLTRTSTTSPFSMKKALPWY